MADRTGIEWTDATWNPVRGCARVSDGCRHCYAERVAARFSGPGQPYEGLIHPSTRGWNGKAALVPEALQIPWRWTRARRIFVNSMSDLFHPDVPFEFIAAVFYVMGHTCRHTYQVLTKRPERMLEFFRWVEDYDGVFPGDRISAVASEFPAIKALGWEAARGGRGGYDNCGPAWPYENVWLGVSVENQETADERIPLLLQCPAAVRWISAEPLLGPVNLTDVTDGQAWREVPREHWVEGFDSWDSPPALRWDAIGGVKYQRFGDYEERTPRIDWVVAGGESGPEARPVHPDWIRSLRDQCAAADVPFLFKQWGEWFPADQTEAEDGVPTGGLYELTHDWSSVLWSRRIGKKASGRHLDGVLHDAYPYRDPWPTT